MALSMCCCIQVGTNRDLDFECGTGHDAFAKFKATGIQPYNFGGVKFRRFASHRVVKLGLHTSLPQTIIHFASTKYTQRELAGIAHSRSPEQLDQANRNKTRVDNLQATESFHQLVSIKSNDPLLIEVHLPPIHRGMSQPPVLKSRINRRRQIDVPAFLRSCVVYTKAGSRVRVAASYI
jgi:hypothetical protein